MIGVRNLLRALGMAAAAAIPFAPVSAQAEAIWLCLTPKHEVREVARVATGPGGDFSLSFIHSVSKTPVIDTYRVIDHEIVQLSEVFVAHGAGLPSFADDVETDAWRHEDGKFILDMHRRTGPIHLRVQAEFLNTLHASGVDLPLANLRMPALTLTPCTSGEP